MKTKRKTEEEPKTGASEGSDDKGGFLVPRFVPVMVPPTGFQKWAGAFFKFWIDMLHYAGFPALAAWLLLFVRKNQIGAYRKAGEIDLHAHLTEFFKTARRVEK